MFSDTASSGSRWSTCNQHDEPESDALCESKMTLPYFEQYHTEHFIDDIASQSSFTIDSMHPSIDSVDEASHLRDQDDYSNSSSPSASNKGRSEGSTGDRLESSDLRGDLGKERGGLLTYLSRALYGLPLELSTPETSVRGVVRRRTFLRYQVQREGNKWRAIITLKQPKILENKKSPQGNRNAVVSIATCVSKESALRLCQANVPPQWSGLGDPSICCICQQPSSKRRRTHHCRNCGYFVCTLCSSKAWPASMVPPSYHNKERSVRVCDTCNYLMETFAGALRAGDVHTALAAYGTGNVNLHCPLTVFKDGNYPVHCAAQGGNTDLMRWLVGPCMCCVKLPNGTSLLNSNGQSVLAVAAQYGNLSVMKMLVQEAGMLVTDISAIDDLLRGLHAALDVCIH